MQGWRLESPDREEVASVLNTASNTVVADIQELPPTVQTLHWVAPSPYLGDRVRELHDDSVDTERDTAAPFLKRFYCCQVIIKVLILCFRAVMFTDLSVFSFIHLLQ